MATNSIPQPAKHDQARPPSKPAKPDILDDAVSIDELEAGDDEDNELLSDDERNATGGALPYSDDGDNDNDDEDARERALPDHLRRDKDDVPD